MFIDEYCIFSKFWGVKTLISYLPNIKYYKFYLQKLHENCHNKIGGAYPFSNNCIRDLYFYLNNNSKEYNYDTVYALTKYVP